MNFIIKETPLVTIKGMSQNLEIHGITMLIYNVYVYFGTVSLYIIRVVTTNSHPLFYCTTERS